MSGIRRSANQLLSAALVALLACNPFGEDDEPAECSTEFAMIQFWIVDTSRTPQANFGITITNTRTNTVYDVQQPNHTVGLYSALDDSFREELRRGGDAIRVHGEEGGREFDVNFVIAPGECHVYKMLGPDSVIVAP